MKTITDSSFNEELINNDLMLVDFWAEWCGPCKLVAPILEEIERDKAGALTVGKLDIDENLDVARRFEVMSIPTMILFKKGEPVARIVGAKSKNAILRELESHF